MIKATELRIGNIVLMESEEDGIYNKMPIEDGQEIDNSERFNPIPLTPEILERCGFKGLPHFNIGDNRLIEIGRNRYISIGCVGTPNEMVWLCSRNEDDKRKIDDLICLHNFDYDGKLHLHQLQNLFYSLKGQELQIKELAQ